MFRRGRAWTLVLLLLAVASAGCFGGSEEEDRDAPAESDIPWCAHPWPCGGGEEWPADLRGPFGLARTEPIEVAMRDGVVLRGWVHMPDVPEGVRVPVVLRALPYLGQTYVAPDSPADPFVRSGAFPRDALVAGGYAAAEVNVRGSGASDGCFEHQGLNEQRDVVELVEWLAAQRWSNGRVGMTGLSYGGTTPWFAAQHAPEALKTIVPIGIITDLYQFYHTPQGASSTGGGHHLAAWAAGNSMAPPLLGSPTAALDHAGRAPQRWCDDVAKQFTGAITEFHGDERDATFWDDRRTLDDLPNVTAAVWTIHGMQEGAGHAYQDDLVWNALDPSTPKSMLLGQWGHSAPPQVDWETRLMAWFDFWLKGIGGPPPQLDEVHYEARLGEWQVTASWPPAEARDEALYLTPDGLQARPPTGTLSFKAAPHDGGPYAMLCDTLGSKTGTYEDTAGRGLVVWSEAMDADVLVAGNPFALLALESDDVGGLVSVDVFEVAPDAACDPTDRSGPNFYANLEDDVHDLTRGTADLRFFRGGYEAQPLPTGERVLVRIDLHGTAHRVPTGHHLAVVVSYGDSGHRTTSMPYTPDIRFVGTGSADDTHLVFPVAVGTLGGDPTPGIDYPPRPFATT